MGLCVQKSTRSDQPRSTSDLPYTQLGVIREKKTVRFLDLFVDGDGRGDDVALRTVDKSVQNVDLGVFGTETLLEKRLLLLQRLDFVLFFLQVLDYTQKTNNVPWRTTPPPASSSPEEPCSSQCSASTLSPLQTSCPPELCFQNEAPPRCKDNERKREQSASSTKRSGIGNPRIQSSIPQALSVKRTTILVLSTETSIVSLQLAIARDTAKTIKAHDPSELCPPPSVSTENSLHCSLVG